MANNHNEDEQPTVVEALGLSLKWADKNTDVLRESFELHDAISDLILSLGLSVKEDSFGKMNGDAANLSEYELKLLYSGYQIARYMEKQAFNKFRAGMESGNPFGGNPFLDMLRGSSGSGAIRVKMGEDGNIEDIRGIDSAPDPIRNIIRDIINGIKKRDSDKDEDND